MIVIKQGDIIKDMDLDNKIDVVFHQCNCFNTMGKGIAKTLSDKWPQVKYIDNETIPGDINKMGTFTLANIQNKIGHLISVVNLYAQYSFKYGPIYKGMRKWYIKEEYGEDGRLKPMTSLPHLKSSIEKMLIQFDNLTLNFATVKIGCGLGGANWENDVYPILDELFNNRNLTIYIL